MADEPNQGAAADVPDVEDTKPSGDAGPAGAGAPVNQGAPGAGPEGSSAYEPGAAAHSESPLGVAAASDLYADRPELFVGAAFVGGFAIAKILKRLGG
jgi:hypothetical protein